MTVLFVGSNHATAPLALLERLAYSTEEAAALLSRVAAGAPGEIAMGSATAEPLPFREMLVLSTSHRVELYAVPADDAVNHDQLLDTLAALLARHAQLEEIGGRFHRLGGADAERHLCRVAVGLESLVLGESDVRANLADALAVATRCGAAGPVLGALGEAALRIAKRARDETGIGDETVTICSVAAELAEELADDLRGRRALIIGGGEPVAKTAGALRERGYWDMLISGMDPDAAADLAAATRGKTVAVESLSAALAESDLVVVGCAGVPLDASLVRAAMRGRMARPLAIIDLATPSSVDATVRELPGLRLVDMEELRERLDLAIARRHHQVPLVETIVEEELRAAHARFEGGALLAILGDLRARADEIRRREVQRALERVPDASPELRAQLEALSLALTSKLLEAPTRRLHRELANGHAESYAGIARALFGLADGLTAAGDQERSMSPGATPALRDAPLLPALPPRADSSPTLGV